MSERQLMQFNAGGGEMGPPRTWEEIAHFLWGLLDDVDTAGDMFKPEWQGFEKYVTQKANERWKVATSDGYSLVFNIKE